MIEQNEINRQSETKCALSNVTIHKQRNHVVMLHQAANSNACSARPHWMVQRHIRYKSVVPGWRKNEDFQLLGRCCFKRLYWLQRLLHTKMNQQKSHSTHTQSPHRLDQTKVPSGYTSFIRNSDSPKANHFHASINSFHTQEDRLYHHRFMMIYAISCDVNLSSQLMILPTGQAITDNDSMLTPRSQSNIHRQPLVIVGSLHPS